MAKSRAHTTFRKTLKIGRGLPPLLIARTATVVAQKSRARIKTTIKITGKKVAGINKRGDVAFMAKELFDPISTDAAQWDTYSVEQRERGRRSWVAGTERKKGVSAKQTALWVEVLKHEEQFSSDRSMTAFLLAQLPNLFHMWTPPTDEPRLPRENKNPLAAACQQVRRLRVAHGHPRPRSAKRPSE